MRNFSCYEKPVTTITETAKKLREHPELIKLNNQLANITRSSQYNDALHLFDKIRSPLYQHLKPDQYTLSITLTACANIPNIKFGDKLHAHAIKSGLRSFLHVANPLLSLYAKAKDIVSVKWVFDEIENPDVYSYTTLLSSSTKMGHVDYACEVFDKMPNRDLAVWNAIITGCMESGNEEIGFSLFKDMCRFGVRHDNYSFAKVLSGCDLAMVDFGMQVHSLVIKTGYMIRTSVVNALITMYFKSENILDAYLVFAETEYLAHDQITYNVMIDGLLSMGKFEEALIMFRKMLETCLRPTELTFLSFMSSILYTEVGHQIHVQAIKMGFEGRTSFSNATISMYSRCGDLSAAYMVFKQLERKDLVSWNTMISSYAQVNLSNSAISTYLEMQRIGMEPDEFTFGSLLTSSELTETVEMIHAVLLRNSLISNIQISNALVSAYSKHGNMKQAYQIFCDVTYRNLISWNAIISGFLSNGLPIQGLERFSELLMLEFRPNEYTLSIILSICAGISALRLGKQVHGYILSLGFSSKASLSNALITMYAKCGLIDWSSKVFNAMTTRDLVSWNALISACAQNGKGSEAVYWFESMLYPCGVKPDDATFKIILSACSHAGLVDDGIRIFNSMTDKYGVVPGVDHFSCIVDLLGRAGYFDEVERIIKSEHFEAHPNIWWTLLSACAAHGNLKLGRLVAGFLLEIEHDKPSVYVLLSNMYAAAGQWEEAAKLRHLMDNTRAMKQTGYSWISP
ncbi:hypothetical protein JCGZ_12578 [Jatropha curcas]|uniref:Pentacotripeptide-repeat region of PRORP domain-containing protein n=1 Tax=Jatropha curcas TaxID=180498 RepID=A0A067K7L8_JATCU|nr:pentatricopeptide repeat-containing protein At3g49740 [Jatropha curcas]KDP32117.1 hypothetical protein JCGZ_12578 [Jatropha curcas]